MLELLPLLFYFLLEIAVICIYWYIFSVSLKSAPRYVNTMRPGRKNVSTNCRFFSVYNYLTLKSRKQSFILFSKMFCFAVIISTKDDMHEFPCWINNRITSIFLSIILWINFLNIVSEVLYFIIHISDHLLIPSKMDIGWTKSSRISLLYVL